MTGFEDGRLALAIAGVLNVIIALRVMASLTFAAPHRQRSQIQMFFFLCRLGDRPVLKTLDSVKTAMRLALPR